MLSVKKILLFIKRKYLYIIVLFIAIIIFFIFYSYNNTTDSVAYVVIRKIEEEKLIKRIYEECPYEINAIGLSHTVTFSPENKKDTKKLKKWMQDFKDKNDFKTLQIK